MSTLGKAALCQKIIKDEATKANKDPNSFEVILTAFPNITDSKGLTTNEDGQRFPFTGTVDQIGNDIKSTKVMGIDHVIFVFNFLPIGRGVDGMIEQTKQLSKFAR